MIQPELAAEMMDVESRGQVSCEYFYKHKLIQHYKLNVMIYVSQSSVLTQPRHGAVVSVISLFSGAWLCLRWIFLSVKALVFALYILRSCFYEMDCISVQLGNKPLFVCSCFSSIGDVVSFNLMSMLQ